MKILKRSHYETVTTYFLDFPYAGEAGRYGSGYSFECDEAGNVKAQPGTCGHNNYLKCLTGEVDGQAVRKSPIRKYERDVRHPGVGECNRCSREVVLGGFTNTCQCGTDYNSAGQELAHRSQWGEETGEHWTECY